MPLVTLEEDALPFFFVCEAVVLVGGVLRDGWYAAFLLRPAMMVLVEGRSPEAAACCVGEGRGKEEGVTASSPLNRAGWRRSGGVRYVLVCLLVCLLQIERLLL